VDASGKQVLYAGLLFSKLGQGHVPARRRLGSRIKSPLTVRFSYSSLGSIEAAEDLPEVECKMRELETDPNLPAAPIMYMHNAASLVFHRKRIGK
jgi:hypothetical protein